MALHGPWHRGTAVLCPQLHHLLQALACRLWAFAVPCAERKPSFACSSPEACSFLPCSFPRFSLVLFAPLGGSQRALVLHKSPLQNIKCCAWLQLGHLLCWRGPRVLSSHHPSVLTVLVSSLGLSCSFQNHPLNCPVPDREKAHIFPKPKRLSLQQRKLKKGGEGAGTEQNGCPVPRVTLCKYYGRQLCLISTALCECIEEEAGHYNHDSELKGFGGTRGINHAGI